MEPLYCEHSSDSFMIKGGVLVVFLYIAETMHSVLIGGGILISWVSTLLVALSTGSLGGGEREPGNHCMRMRQPYQENMISRVFLP